MANSTATTLTELIDRRAAQTPDAIYLLAPESARRLTYRELRDRCRQIGRRLDRLTGPGPAQTVALLLDNGLHSALLLLGIMYSGRTALALNASAGQDQLCYALRHSGAGALFIDDRYRDKLADALTADNAGTPRVVAATGSDEPHWPDDDAAGGDVTPRAAPAPAAGDAALLLYTSGTTGRPKGALLSHANLLAGGANVSDSHRLTADDRALCVLPLFHINGLVVTLIGPLVSGGSVVLPRRFSAGRFWSLLAEHRCTWFSVVPTIISYLLDRAADEPYRFGDDPRLARLRFGRSASAPLPEATFTAFENTFKLPMIETMGLTETAAPILSNPLPPARRKIGSPGIPFGNDVKVADADGAELPDGETGELLIRGPNVLNAYLNNPDANAAAFSADGWFRSGDLGYRDRDGYFFITGRSKELIIKGGENIAPREIDEALYRHPAVLDAAAAGVPDLKYGQQVVAGVVLKQDAAGRDANRVERELIEFCAQRVGEFRAPQRIYFLPALPQGPSGKIQRLKLAQQLQRLSD